MSVVGTKRRVPAIVLAAGASTRFGSPKQRLLLGPVLERVRTSGVSNVVVVLGAHEVDVDAKVVHCGEWSRGPGASLRCGLAALPTDVDGAIVVLADGPDLNPAAIDRVLEHAATGEVLAASYGGERGHPLFVPRTAFGDVPDEGMRAMPARLVPCDDLGFPGDVDFPEDMPAAFDGRRDVDG